MSAPDPAYLISASAFKIGTRTLSASLYSVHYRNTGRRIVVREAGAVVFDSHNCYDLGNANNRLRLWIMDNTKCAHCNVQGQMDDWGQDAHTFAPICAACCRRATTPAEPACVRVPAVATGVPAECPF